MPVFKIDCIYFLYWIFYYLILKTTKSLARSLEQSLDCQETKFKFNNYQTTRSQSIEGCDVMVELVWSTLANLVVKLTVKIEQLLIKHFRRWWPNGTCSRAASKPGFWARTPRITRYTGTSARISFSNLTRSYLHAPPSSAKLSSGRITSASKVGLTEVVYSSVKFLTQ